MEQLPHEQLIDEIKKLRETGEALVDRVEDVAASIRYMTNNLLDEQYHPEMAAGVHQLAQQVGQLVSLSPSANAGEALPPFAAAVDEFARRAEKSIEGVTTSSGDSSEAANIESSLAAANGQSNASEKGEGIGDTGAARQQTLFSAATQEASACEPNAEPSPADPAVAEFRESPAGGMDSLNSHHRPYTVDDYRSFCKRKSEQEISTEAWKAEYKRLRDERCSFVDHLLRNHNAQQLKDLALRSGCMHARQQTKPQNADSIYRACLQGFVLGNSIQYNPMAEKIEDAIDRIVEGLTDDDFAKYYELQRQREYEHKKAIENPETLGEFHTFVREMGEHNLSDEQHLRRDQLYADLSRKTRAESKPTTVQQFQSAELDDLEFTIKEGYHEKRECPLWIVQLTSRVDRQSFGELKTKAKQLGGWYSSFKKSDAGFQFLTQEAAEKFAGLSQGDADRSDELEERKIRKLTNTAERFAAMADRLTEQAEATLEADDDKLKNTVRRAEMAASVRAQARKNLATAATLKSLANSLQEGQATYLDEIRYGVQVETLRSLLRRARWTHTKHLMENQHGDLSPYDKHLKQDELEERPLELSDIRFAEYPKPYLYRGHLEQAFAKLANTKGVKQITAKMQKLVNRAPNGQDYVEFYRDHDIELLEDFLSRAKSAGYNCYWFDECLVDYKRLRSANIDDAHELRAALAELLPHLTPAGLDDPVTLAIDSLRGKDLPGFFPTPKPLIHRMLDLAEIEGTDRVLEPSAGMGDILDAVRQRFPDVELTALEQNRTLAEVLAASGDGGMHPPPDCPPTDPGGEHTGDGDGDGEGGESGIFPIAKNELGITRPLFDSVVEELSFRGKEEAGLLFGPEDTQIATYFVRDTLGKKTRSSFTLDTASLNAAIRAVKPWKLQLLAVVHCHPNGVRQPSGGDIRYVRELFAHPKNGSAEQFFMPLVVNGQFIPYLLYRNEPDRVVRAGLKIIG